MLVGGNTLCLNAIMVRVGYQCKTFLMLNVLAYISTSLCLVSPSVTSSVMSVFTDVNQLSTMSLAMTSIDHEIGM